MPDKRVLIMAGGTGGHIFPGLALAKEMQARGHKVSWLGTKAGMEANLVPNEGIDIHYIPVHGVRGKGMLTLLSAPWNILSSIISAAKVLSAFKPNVVVGLGGFVAGPGGVAAKLQRRPLVIHEQNAVAGTTNKLLAKIANKVFSAFPNQLKNAECIGNPVRHEIEAITSPEERLSNRHGDIHVLVLGGSRGALAINELVPETFAQLNKPGEVKIWHQAGKDKDAEARAKYEALGVEARVDAFIDDMVEAFNWADIVICRSGALTVSELAAVGLGAVLIPFPYAIDDHQTANGMYLVNNGAAVLKQQNELDPHTLAELLKEFMFERVKLLDMALNARALAKPETVKRFADYCEEVACA